MKSIIASVILTLSVSAGITLAQGVGCYQLDDYGILPGCELCLPGYTFYFGNVGCLITEQCCKGICCRPLDGYLAVQEG
jgi:hypothetical protein